MNTEDIPEWMKLVTEAEVDNDKPEWMQLLQEAPEPTIDRYTEVDNESEYISEKQSKIERKRKKKTRSTWTVQQKLDILQAVDAQTTNGCTLTKAVWVVSDEKDISTSTLFGFINQREQLEERIEIATKSRKKGKLMLSKKLRGRGPQYIEVEELLLEWHARQLKKGIPTNHKAFRKRARELAGILHLHKTCRFGRTWFRLFLNRSKLSLRAVTNHKSQPLIDRLPKLTNFLCQLKFYLNEIKVENKCDDGVPLKYVYY